MGRKPPRPNNLDLPKSPRLDSLVKSLFLGTHVYLSSSTPTLVLGPLEIDFPISADRREKVESLSRLSLFSRSLSLFLFSFSLSFLLFFFLT